MQNKQSFITADLPVITHKMWSPIWRTDLNQEAIPGGSQLKVLESHEVSAGTAFNHLACAWILSSFFSILPEMLYPSKTGGINNRAKLTLLSQALAKVNLLPNMIHVKEFKDFPWFAIAVVVIVIPAQGKSILPNVVPSLGLTSPGIEHPWLCITSCMFRPVK